MVYGYGHGTKQISLQQKSQSSLQLEKGCKVHSPYSKMFNETAPFENHRPIY